MTHAERFSLKDKVALVIGGSSGIGREIALGYREAGAHVAVLGRTQHCHGFFGASSMERLPTEKAITRQTQDFKQISF